MPMEQRLDIPALPAATEPTAETENDAAPPTASRGWRRLIPQRSSPVPDVADAPIDPEVAASAQPTQVIVAPPNPDGATGLIAAPQGPPPPPVNRLRRERRKLMREREELVFHLGGLAYELHRRDLLTSDVAQRRATAIMELDDAVHEIDAHLAAHDRARRAGRRGGVVVAEPVEVGACLVCRAPFIADARFCSQCGARFAPITSWDAPHTQILPPIADDA
jgi:hypothetical protein